MRDYNKVSGIRSDRPMTYREIITAADNLREVERVASTEWRPGIFSTIITLLCVGGLLVYIVIPAIMLMFNL